MSDSTHITLSGTEAWELFLLRLRYRDSVSLPIAANRPLVLDDDASCWITYAGDVDVFLVKIQDNGEPGTRHYLFSARAGSALFGVTADSSVRLLVSGKPGTEVLKVSRETLADLSKDEGFKPLVATLIDHWITGISLGILDNLPPREYTHLQAEQEYEVPEDTNLRPLREVLWVSHVTGASEFAGCSDWPLPGEGHYCPVTHRSWITATEPSTLTTTRTEARLGQEGFWEDLEQFHSLVMTALQKRTIDIEESARHHLESKIDAELSGVDRAISNLASILRPAGAARFADLGGQDPLLDACRIIGNATGITFRPAPGVADKGEQVDPLEEIARASGVRLRRVALRDEWWQFDNGPLLAYVEETRQPVALLPVAKGCEIHDPVACTTTPVTEKLSYTLEPFAYTFYRPFPNKALNLPDLLKFGFRGTFHELRRLILMGVLAGLVALVAPVLTGFLFDVIIPASQRSQLIQIGLALFAGALAITLFNVVQGIAMLRLETRMDASLQAAVTDRLLNLPTTFFRDYTAGELGQRALSISAIRAILSQRVLSMAFAFVFSIFSLIVLFYYDAHLALVALALVAALMAVMLVITYFQVNHQREYTEIQNRFSGATLQLINGIAKLRVAGAQRRAFARWANLFTRQQQVSVRAQLLGVGLATFNELYSVVVSMVIFGAVVFASQSRLTTGSFLAFNTAFTQFMTAALALSGAITAMIAIIPLYESAQPILEALPEVDETKSHPGELTGRIGVSRVSFRYTEDGPIVLDDVSLEFEPGEFVAIVGPSGSGKSTLVRLLLGFETPDTGTILYDNQDLARLDVQSVRRQIGVVLQNGKLFTGTIHSNIIGAAPLSAQDAWDAAEKAGFAEDIKAMPMGMHTLVTESAGTISGGQRQRLLIARAIVKKPRIVIFDEATSALDSKTQATVSQSLEDLDATRIVIAHRLSTIANADRIYVLQDGRVVQHGTYDQLIHQKGLFADLARRQLA